MNLNSRNLVGAVVVIAALFIGAPHTASAQLEACVDYNVARGSASGYAYKALEAVTT